jgi:hypothetical protein
MNLLRWSENLIIAVSRERQFAMRRAAWLTNVGSLKERRVAQAT